MPKIVGANDPIRDVKWGNTQVTDVYKGSTLLWRGFHVTVGECFNGSYNLPLVYGPGTTMTVPHEFTGGYPPGHILNGFTMNGQRLYAGDTYTFEEDPSNMTTTNYWGGSVPYSYKYKLKPNYVVADQVTVVVKLSWFDITVGLQRADYGAEKVLTGYPNGEYGYNLAELSEAFFGLSNSYPGLSIAGITDLSGAAFLPRWYPGVSASTGASTAPPLKAIDYNYRGTFGYSSGEAINYFYVYNYNGYYFI